MNLGMAVALETGLIVPVIRDADGIQLDVKSVNWSAVQKKKASVVAKLVGGVTGLMKANKIRVINGTASFAGPKKLNIEQQSKVSEEAFDSIIIAAGSVPAVPPIPGLKDNPRCMVKYYENSMKIKIGNE